MASEHLKHLKILTKKLEKNDRELELFFESSLDMLAVMDIEGRFLRINEAWTQSLGWSSEELMTRSYLDLVHPHDRNATIKEFTEVIDENKKIYYFRNRAVCKDGSYRVLCWTARSSKNGLHIYGVARDFDKMMERTDG